MFVALAIVGALNLATSSSSSPEWIYTIGWINRIALVALVIACIVYLPDKTLTAAIISSAILFAIPYYAPFYQYLSWQCQYLLSACWGLAFILAGIAFFRVALKRAALISILLCLTGSIIMAIGVGEFYLLFTAQPSDAIVDASSRSRHALTTQGVPEHESWAPGQCGMTPGTPGRESRAFHRMQKFDEDLFDVAYSFNSRGWRKLPKSANDAPNDLILFGCSLTFGYGLEDNQTWSWQLASFLGPNWKLENYAGSAYGANQMLCLLEKHLIDPPQGSHRYALFLAIEDHLIRNEFFSSMPHYQSDANGDAQAGGQGGYNWLHLLPVNFNGSQLAREIRNLGMALKRRTPGAEKTLYLAMLKQSADLLHNNYGTRLFVLLWPDIENLKPDIEALGIQVIMAKQMLPEWDKGKGAGSAYYIKYPFEPHPNAEASVLLAKGLAKYFQELNH